MRTAAHLLCLVRVLVGRHEPLAGVREDEACGYELGALAAVTVGFVLGGRAIDDLNGQDKKGLCENLYF